MNNNIISVTALNTVINMIFKAEEHLHDIQVAGEVSGFKVFKGHGYFTLKDEKCQISCTCFNCAKTYQPKDGESVIVKGSVDYYAAGGRLNFNVDSIQAVGKGLLAIKLEMLKNRLRQEGYFDEAHKKPIPQYPSNICVITSFNGAVIKDIKRTVRRKNDLINIFIKDVKVQGKDAHIEIVDALEKVDAMGFDVIIIARGGGSFEDLLPFNEELLVKAIYACKTPVISAVGHESDVTLCDEAADYRAATPTAAAECVAYDVIQLKEYVEYCKTRVKTLVLNKLKSDETELRNKMSLLISGVKLTYQSNRHRLDNALGALKNSMNNIYVTNSHRLESVITKLEAANPLNMLKKGFWHVSKDGKTLLSVKGLKEGTEIDLRANDGKLKARITEVKNEV